MPSAYSSPPALLLLVVLPDQLLVLLRDEEGAGDVFVFEVRVALVGPGDGRVEEVFGVFEAVGLDGGGHVADGLREQRDGEVLADLGVAQRVGGAPAQRERGLLAL